MTGRSQAVRLPAEFRFDTDEVYIRRNPDTGDVVLSRRPGDWQEFFAPADANGGLLRHAGFKRLGFVQPKFGDQWPHALSTPFAQRLCRGQDAQTLDGGKVEQVGIASDQHGRVRRQSGADEVVVVRVT